jgi:hypothetical protein
MIKDLKENTIYGFEHILSKCPTKQHNLFLHIFTLSRLFIMCPNISMVFK